MAPRSTSYLLNRFPFPQQQRGYRPSILFDKRWGVPPLALSAGPMVGFWVSSEKEINDGEEKSNALAEKQRSQLPS